MECRFQVKAPVSGEHHHWQGVLQVQVLCPSARTDVDFHLNRLRQLDVEGAAILCICMSK